MADRIAFGAHFAYSAISSAGAGHVGGVERQMGVLSKELVRQGKQVSVITWDEGQDDDIVVDGVRVIKLCKESDGVRFLRFFVPRWTSLVRALSKADADVYYHNCAEYVTGQIAAWCNWNQKSFVYSIASDPECENPPHNMIKFRDRMFYKYGLRQATAVGTQTDVQKNTLLINYGIDAEKIPMAGSVELNISNESDPRQLLTEFSVLWLGRLAPVKRAEWLLEIARRMPETRFDLVGGFDRDQVYSDHILGIARNLENLKNRGKVPFKQVFDFFNSTSILLNTSEYEGFPNTFLEAWSYGVPVVSTVDPDSVLSRNNIGVVVKTIDDAIRAIEKLKSNPNLLQGMSQNCLNYYGRNHSPSVVASKLANFLNRAHEERNYRS